MRDALATQFEEYVDRVLSNRWQYQQFKFNVAAKLDALKEELQIKIHRFVDEQKHIALARAAARIPLRHPIYLAPSWCDRGTVRPSGCDVRRRRRRKR